MDSQAMDCLLAALGLPAHLHTDLRAWLLAFGPERLWDFPAYRERELIQLTEDRSSQTADEHEACKAYFRKMAAADSEYRQSARRAADEYLFTVNRILEHAAKQRPRRG